MQPGVFIKQGLLKRLGVHGQKPSLSLKALTAEKSEETVMVYNLIVTGVNKMDIRILIKKTYSKKKQLQSKKKRLQSQIVIS